MIIIYFASGFFLPNITVKFYIGLYTSRPGSPDSPGAVIVRPGNKKQEYEVTVTLHNDIGEKSDEKDNDIGEIKIGVIPTKVNAGESIVVSVSHINIKEISSVELRMLKDKKTVSGTSAGHLPDQRTAIIDYVVKDGLPSGYYQLEVIAVDNESKRNTDTFDIVVGDVEEEGPDPV